MTASQNIHLTLNLNPNSDPKLNPNSYPTLVPFDIVAQAFIILLFNSPGTSDVFTANICGNKKKIVLNKCSKSKSKRIQLESLTYVRCNCSCRSCDEVGDLCHSSTLFLKIGRKCQGRKRCRVQITNECEDDILRSLKILYQCSWTVCCKIFKCNSNISLSTRQADNTIRMIYLKSFL